MRPRLGTRCRNGSGLICHNRRRSDGCHRLFHDLSGVDLGLLAACDYTDGLLAVVGWSVPTSIWTPSLVKPEKDPPFHDLSWGFPSSICGHGKPNPLRSKQGPEWDRHLFSRFLSRTMARSTSGSTPYPYPLWGHRGATPW